MGSLRYGWTTGACATAATVAACRVLMGGVAPPQVTIPLKRRVLTQGVFVIHDWGWHEDGAFASVIKDAGDDPDVTDGAKVSVLVRRGAVGSGIVFKAGAGVGTVTKPGLALAVGEAAINDAPRRMMTDAIKKEMSQNDVCVTVSVADGERLAQRTMNAQLGIVGGLSILGTSGIVVPFSCAAWVASLHQAVDVALAVGHRHLGASVGTTSRRLLQKNTSLADDAIIDMGDFIGALVKYVKKQEGIQSFTIAGGFAKMAKWADGAKDLHHKKSSVSLDSLAQWLMAMGAPSAVVQAVRTSHSARDARAIAHKHGWNLAHEVVRRGETRLQEMLPHIRCRIMIDGVGDE